MHIERLSLVNFKNYSDCHIDLHSKLNCFVGDNGVGKTNLLDAIYYLCMCKSYFNASDAYNLRYHCDFLTLQAKFVNEDTIDDIHCGIQRSKKKIFRKNKKEYPRLIEHVGNYPVVMVSPSDSTLILDGGEERRKYMNGVISQFNRDYLDKTIQYTRVLSQRNKLLKDLSFANGYDLLETYNQQLTPLANVIFNERKNFVERLTPVFQKYYKFISGGGEQVKLQYRSQLEDTGLETLLQQYASRDKAVQHTTVGVHKDELELTMDDVHMKKVASQGQQKTFLVALKMAQFEFLASVKGVKPLLLLDDIFDKFDNKRVSKILELVSGNEFGQIFITHHNEHGMQDLLKNVENVYNLYRVAEETVKNITHETK